MPAPQDYPLRFRWPARLLIGLFLFDMFFRSAFNLGLFGNAEDAKFVGRPMGLPSEKERQQIEKTEHPDEYDAYGDRVADSFASLVDFLSPKYVFVWIDSRLEFFGKILGIDQDWPMFSPNVGKREKFVRAKLIYEDGSTGEWRQKEEPADLSSYTHWLCEKHLVVYGLLLRDDDTRLGFCNWLSNHYAKSKSGSPLKTIEFYYVIFKKPPPEGDIAAAIRAQQGPPADQVYPPYWRYDVKTRRGVELEN